MKNRPNLSLSLLLFLSCTLQTTAKVDKVSLALMLAVESKNIEDTQTLLANGGNPTTVNRYSISLLHTATSNGDQPMVKLLLEHNASINYALDSRSGHREGESALHFAAADNQPEVATILLSNGADPKQFTAGGMTPLHLAAGLGHVHFLRAMEPFISGDMINIEGNNRYGSQPIHLAATSGHVQVTQELLKMGAHPHTPNKRGSYPLHGAAIVGDVETVVLLLEAGADPSALNGENKTPLQVAEARSLSSDTDDELIQSMTALRKLLKLEEMLSTEL